MDAIVQLLEMLVPIIVGIVSVPIFSGIKSAVTFIDGLNPNIQRVLVAVQAWGLAQLAALLNILPLLESLAVFDLTTVETIAAAALAYALHFVKSQTGK